jgi:hypothetical protein
MGEIINYFEGKDRKERVTRGTNELVVEIWNLIEGLRSMYERDGRNA